MKIKSPNHGGKRIVKECKNCQQEFSELLIRVRAGRGFFCSDECYKDYRFKNKKNEKEQNRFYQKKHKYGLTEYQYKQMFIDQDNACKICFKPFTNETKTTGAFVDHDHKTGKVRGLLCCKCNTVLGFVEDDITILEKCILYLSPGIDSAL